MALRRPTFPQHHPSASGDGGCEHPGPKPDSMSASDLAIVAGIVFLWGTLSARLERYDVTAPILFVFAGLVLTPTARWPRWGSRLPMSW